MAVASPNSWLYIRAIAKMAQQLADLRRCLDELHATPEGQHMRSRSIHVKVVAVARVLDRLPEPDSAYLLALGHALRLHLSLMWPFLVDAATTTRLLQGLKVALAEPKVRLCAAVHLTAWELFVGAVAAEDQGQRTQTWFMSRLGRTLVSMQVDSWEGVLKVLARTFMPDARLLTKFESVWSKLGASG
jgi:hypothetical protein